MNTKDIIKQISDEIIPASFLELASFVCREGEEALLGKYWRDFERAHKIAVSKLINTYSEDEVKVAFAKSYELNAILFPEKKAAKEVLEMFLSGQLPYSENEYIKRIAQKSKSTRLKFQEGFTLENIEKITKEYFQFLLNDLKKNHDLALLVFQAELPSIFRQILRDELRGRLLFPHEEKDTEKGELIIPEGYRNWINDTCHYMDLRNLMAKGKAIQVDLPEVFIKLFTDTPREFEETEKKEVDKEQKPVDIEDLVKMADYLLVEGHAGSGKTTLLKHMAYSIMNKTYGRGMDDFLPVLIFLKDLEDGYDTKKNKAANAERVKTVLNEYFSSKGLAIPMMMAYCKARKTVFLLDGLDEVGEKFRDVLVNVLADFRTQYPCKVILSGRPHGMDAAVVQRFGKYHIKINKLKMQQVEVFIRKWFGFIFSKGLGIGSKTAEEMIGDIKIHPNVYELIDNPLMLTAVCILYHDERRLPEQRAELYKKFVDNLVYRRFNNPEKVNEFLMTLAYRIHIRERRGFDRSLGLVVLKDVYPSEEEETDSDYHRRCSEKFESIEQNCGLLKLERGEYDFWHLTFQEFMAARYIATMKFNYAKEIKDYWSNDWYKEFIELFIGFLSIDSKGWANELVKNELSREDISPFKHWRLAASSLLDMHKNTRDALVLKKARERLISIFTREKEPKIKADAGEILGWLGDPRNLKEFGVIDGGQYKLEGLGTKEIDAFEISKYLVTNQWYAEFIEEGGYRSENLKRFWTPEGLKWIEKEKVSYPKFWHNREWNCPNVPVVGVNWYEVVAFCNWLTEKEKDGFVYRLPTEWEWQAATAGKERRKYPWGNEEINETRCNYGGVSNKGIVKTSAVGIFEQGKTPETEIHDLSGNVWEWCANKYSQSNVYFALRGGGWFGHEGNCHSAERHCSDPGIRNVDYGFRLARGQKEQQEEGWKNKV